MKIRILVGTVVARKCVSAGDIVDVTDNEASLLIGMKKAEKVDEVPVVEEMPPAVVQPAEEVMEKPKPKKGKKK